MAMVGARSKFFHYNTLVCLLKALERKWVTVELRGNVTLYGRLENVHPDMSLDMKDVTRTEVGGKSTYFCRFYIRSRHIGMVHIPDDVDIVRAIQWQLNKSEYYRDKERQEKNKLFQRKQRMKDRNRVQLQKKGKL